MNRTSYFALSVVLFFSCAAFAQEAAKPKPNQRAVIEQVRSDPTIFSDANLSLKQIGKLRAVPSKEIPGSALSIGFECLDRKMFEPEKCYDKLAATGIKWARCQTGWNRCETEKGKYDFTWLDEIVDNLLRRGIQPWFNVGYGNKIYMPDAFGEAAVGWVPLYFGDEVRNAWISYVKALAEHFKGRVVYYEIWNEADIDSFWQPKKASPDEYFKLIEITSQAIRSVDKEAKTGACVSRLQSRFVLDLIRGGVAKHIDFFGVHPYEIVPEKTYESHIRSIRNVFRENGGAHVEIWQGESGFASYFPAKHWMGVWTRGNEEMQAKWLTRRFLTDISLGMQRTSFFQMVDMTSKPYEKAKDAITDIACHGLLDGWTYEPKKSYHAATHFAAVFDRDTKYSGNEFVEVSFWGPQPKAVKISRLNEVATVTKTFLRDGYPVYVYYVAEDIQLQWPGIGGVALRTVPDAPKRMTKPILVDLLSGRVFSIDDFQGDTCRRLPLTDYPLVVTDIEALRERIVFD